MEATELLRRIRGAYRDSMDHCGYYHYLDRFDRRIVECCGCGNSYTEEERDLGKFKHREECINVRADKAKSLLHRLITEEVPDGTN